MDGLLCQFLFSAIGKAFATLSDEDKRKKYDLYGPEEDSSSRSSHQPYYESMYP
jgi:DnaJ-class molecular chaperone